MKYRLKRDWHNEYGDVMVRKGTVFVGEITELKSTSLEAKLEDLFEPLSPQEEVEELTEDDFMPTPEEMVDTWTLTDSGKAKLIRKFNSIGKGEACTNV
jgi:hypothetical protein